VFERFRRIRLLYVVLAVLLLVGLLPLVVAGTLVSRRSADELRAIEGRYQAQLVQGKARQIELYGQRYRDVVTGLARAFEIAGGIHSLTDAGSDQRLQRTLQDDPNLIALAICPVKGEIHRAFQPDLIRKEEVDQRITDVLARMSSREVIVGRPQIIRSAQEMGLTIAAPVMDGDQIVAAVVAVVSFQEAFKTVQSSSTKSSREMLEAGLPVVFVVDQNGKAVAHPDAAVAFAERPMTDLKVVEDWLESGSQIQTALAPFTLEREGKSISMLGSYATAELDHNALLGVIAIHQGKFEDAIEHLLRALALTHFYPRAHFNLGVALARLGWWDRAIKAFEVCSQMYPRMIGAYRYLSVIHQRLGHPTEALLYRNRLRDLLAQAKEAGIKLNTDASTAPELPEHPAPEPAAEPLT